MTQDEREAKISSLKQKLLELQKVYAEDVKASHHEPGQTQAMIQMFERQLHDLENLEEPKTGARFILKNSEGERTLVVVKENPDPSKNMISEESEVGMKLLDSKTGSTVLIGDTQYTVVDIDNSFNLF